MSRITRHTSHITHHASHVTHHTSHITSHTSHITRQKSHVCFALHMSRVNPYLTGIPSDFSKFTLMTRMCGFHKSHVTLHTSHIIHHTQHVKCRMSQFTRHTSHTYFFLHTRQNCLFIRYRDTQTDPTVKGTHVTRHTSHVTRHTSHVTLLSL